MSLKQLAIALDQLANALLAGMIVLGFSAWVGSISQSAPK